MTRTMRSFLTAMSLASVASITLLGACGNSTGPDFVRETTLLVAPQLVDCVAVGPQKCMRVRESTVAQWQNFYGGITGFTFEPGYDYELRVRVYRVPNPPADGSSQDYILVKQLRKSATSSKAQSP